MHTIFVLMLMTCYSGPKCKAVPVQTYPTKEDCVAVSEAIHKADDTILGSCQKVAVP